MNNILLISEDTLKTYSNLNRNTFGDWILPAIRESQEMGLMPIIGECLYNKICELVADGSINDILFTAYKDLLDDKIQPYLIYKTLSNIIPIINGKLANIGTVTTNDEHVVNLTQGEADLLKTYYSERCDFYTKRLQDFILNNKQAFPEIACGCGNMQPNLESSENSVGVWLGGSRGKRTSLKGKCGCSSEVTCGDYQSGFTDGMEFQKRKLEIAEFDENGRYIREDGYSEVTVNVAQTGHTDEELYEQYLSGYTSGLSEGYSEGYSSGSTDGYASGYTSGETHQKSLLSALTITKNGDYNREDGYSAITVNVSGQSATLTTTAVTANGEYSAPQGYDGFSSFEVNIPQTGYTQQDLDNAYASGETHQKSLMTSTAVTENGVFTRTNGFSAITVDVPQTGTSGTEIELNQSTKTLTEYGRYYFDFTSATSISAVTINFVEDTAHTSHSLWITVTPENRNEDVPLTLYNSNADITNLNAIVIYRGSNVTNINKSRTVNYNPSGAVSFTIRYYFNNSIIPENFMKDVRFTQNVRKVELYTMISISDLMDNCFSGVNISGIGEGIYGYHTHEGAFASTDITGYTYGIPNYLGNSDIVDDYAFSGCNSLEQITIASTGSTASQNISQYAFADIKQNGTLVARNPEIRQSIAQTTWWNTLANQGWTIQDY